MLPNVAGLAVCHVRLPAIETHGLGVWHNELFGFCFNVGLRLCYTVVVAGRYDTYKMIGLLVDFYSMHIKINLLEPLETDDSAKATMLASESVLRRDWETPEEDAAWSHFPFDPCPPVHRCKKVM